MTKGAPKRREVVPLPGGGVEIREPDGSVIVARDELTYERILRALRKPGRPYVHERPKK